MTTIITTQQDHQNFVSLQQEIAAKGLRIATLREADQDRVVGISPISGKIGLKIGDRISLTPEPLTKGTKVLVNNG